MRRCASSCSTKSVITSGRLHRIAEDPLGILLSVILPGMAQNRVGSGTVTRIGSRLMYCVENARLTQKLIWQRQYPSLTRRLSADDVWFLNLGYEEDPPMGLPLVASDEPNRFYMLGLVAAILTT